MVKEYRYGADRQQSMEYIVFENWLDYPRTVLQKLDVKRKLTQKT